MADLEQRFKVLRRYDVETSVYNESIYRGLRNAPRLQTLAWRGRIKALFYSKENNELLEWVEGDIIVHRDVDSEDIDSVISQYNKAHVAAEGFDSRF